MYHCKQNSRVKLNWVLKKSTNHSNYEKQGWEPIKPKKWYFLITIHFPIQSFIIISNQTISLLKQCDNDIKNIHQDNYKGRYR